jgi:hypothetical protein
VPLPLRDGPPLDWQNAARRITVRNAGPEEFCAAPVHSVAFDPIPEYRCQSRHLSTIAFDPIPEYRCQSRHLSTIAP